MVFANAEQIKEKFHKDGWSTNTSFEELSLEEAKEKGYTFALNPIAKGRKFFKMSSNGNIYNDKGKIAFFNITASLEH